MTVGKLLFAVIVLVGICNVQVSAAVPGVAQIEESAVANLAPTRYEETYRLGAGLSRVPGDSEHSLGHSGRGIYQGLAAEETKEVKEATKVRTDPDQKIIRDGWKPNQLGKCEHCNPLTCNCAPGVCEAGECKNSYAVVFGAKRCSVCPRMVPVIAALRKQGYTVFYIEHESHPTMVKKFKLRLWPTIIVMNDKKVVKRFEGVTQAREISKHMKTRKEQGLDKKEVK
jgi:thiol-disulfide isomerase/thioredoxin